MGARRVLLLRWHMLVCRERIEGSQKRKGREWIKEEKLIGASGGVGGVEYT